MVSTHKPEIVSKQCIKPSNPTPLSLRHLKLSFLDQFENFILNYIPLVFFYQNDEFPTKADPAQRSHQLKQSFAETLTKFYPFAGRIYKNTSIDCNDSGALYVEARVHAHLSEVIQNSTIKDLDQYLAVESFPNPANTNRSNLVLLAVQISFFECGGMALGVSLSHVVADLHSLVKFLNAWAQQCSSTTETFIRPIFYMGFNHFPPLESLANLYGEPEEPNANQSEEKIVIPPELQLIAPEEAYLFPAEEKMVTKRFVIDKNNLSRIKLLLSSSSTCDKPSRVETVLAFIWKHLIDIIRAKSHGTKKEFVSFHAVNMRRRTSPPLPDFAMGNISVLTAALAESKNSTDYFNLFSQIRMAIRNVDSNNIDVNGRKGEYLKILTSPLLKPENEYYFFSSWCKFPFYEVDYGWGKPFSVCTASAKSKNLVILMDTRSGDGVQAWITLAEDEMAMLPNGFLALESNNITN